MHKFSPIKHPFCGRLKMKKKKEKRNFPILKSFYFSRFSFKLIPPHLKILFHSIRVCEINQVYRKVFRASCCFKRTKYYGIVVWCILIGTHLTIYIYTFFFCGEGGFGKFKSRNKYICI